MQKEKKYFIALCLFFIISFVGLWGCFYTTKKANQIFDFLIFSAQNALGDENKFPKKYYNHPLDVAFYDTAPDTKNNFVSITINDVSPLLCSQILMRKRPFLIDTFLNDKPVFFGDDWRCFKGLNHKMTFQFELYNYTFFYDMKEPKPCLDLWDCDAKNDEYCHQGYCKKSEKK